MGIEKPFRACFLPMAESKPLSYERKSHWLRWWRKSFDILIKVGKNPFLYRLYKCREVSITVKVVDGLGREWKNHLATLMEQYGKVILRMCYLYLRDTALAEDAVQETFLKAYKALPNFRGECAEKTWLMRIAINTCKDIRRSAWFRHVDRSIIPEYLPAKSESLIAEQSDLVLEIMRLPGKYKEVILLYYYQGMTLLEISQVLSLSKQTVSARLQTARKKLQILLREEDSHES